MYQDQNHDQARNEDRGTGEQGNCRTWETHLLASDGSKLVYKDVAPRRVHSHDGLAEVDLDFDSDKHIIYK